MIDYDKNLSLITTYKVDWAKEMSSTSFEYLFDKLTKLTSYRSSVAEFYKEAILEKAKLSEEVQTKQINYDNHINYLIVTDEKIKLESKSDKARERAASMTLKALEKRKDLFSSEKKLGQAEAYARVLQGYLSDFDKQVETVNQQIYTMNLDLKINPDKIKLLS